MPVSPRPPATTVPFLGHPSVKPAATSRGSKPTLAPFSSPFNWKSPTGAPKRGNSGSCEGGGPSWSLTMGSGTSRPFGGVPLGVFRPGSGPFQESAASWGGRARAAEPAPSSIPPYASPSPPPQGRQACCYYLLSSPLLPSTSLRALLTPALAAPPGPGEGQRPAPPPQQGWQWAPRGQLRAGDGTGTFSPRQPQLPFSAERGSFSHLSGLQLLGKPKHRKRLFLPIKRALGVGEGGSSRSDKDCEAQGSSSRFLGLSRTFCPTQPSSPAIRVPPCTLP